MTARQAQRFNTFHGAIWLAIYSRAGVPEAFPQVRQTDNLQISFFQRLDQLGSVRQRSRHHDGPARRRLPAEQQLVDQVRHPRPCNDRWFKYCIARYAAYNVRWVLYGEVNETKTCPPAGRRHHHLAGPGRPWMRSRSRTRILTITRSPAITTPSTPACANNPNIDYIEVQIDVCGARTETQYNTALSHRSYGKPVWFEEYWYECSSCDNEYVQGMRNTHRSFVAALAFPTMGSPDA